MAVGHVTCAFSGCNEPATLAGQCHNHYHRAYREKQRNAQPRDCAHCGNRMHGRHRKFCGPECRNAAALETDRKRKGIGPRWADGIPASHKEHTCFFCEATFKPKRAGRTKFCSRQCSYDWDRAKADARNRAVYRAYVPRPAATVLRICQTGCGLPIYRYRQHKCHRCTEAAEAANKMRSKERAKRNGTKAAARKARKLRLRGVTVETVNPLVVLGRDKWTCQMCGVRTPKRLRGTYEDNAPEVDHIVPIAEGGEHSYCNTQCACRKCNIAKSGQPKGQMRLFG